MCLRTVNLHTPGGEERTCLVDSNEPLGAVVDRIGDLFSRPRHVVKLVNDRTLQISAASHDTPFKSGDDNDFTVVFRWANQWCFLGPLPAIANEPANAGWPLQSVDTLYAGSAYATPYTRQAWAPRYGMTLQETLQGLAAEARDHQRKLPVKPLPRGIETAIRRASSYGRISKLTCAKVKQMLHIVDFVRNCDELGAGVRMAGRSLELFLEGTGLKPVRYRYTRKSLPRKVAPLTRRLSDVKRNARTL